MSQWKRKGPYMVRPYYEGRVQVGWHLKSIDFTKDYGIMPIQLDQGTFQSSVPTRIFVPVVTNFVRPQINRTIVLPRPTEQLYEPDSFKVYPTSNPNIKRITKSKLYLWLSIGMIGFIILLGVMNKVNSGVSSNQTSGFSNDISVSEPSDSSSSDTLPEPTGYTGPFKPASYCPGGDQWQYCVIGKGASLTDAQVYKIIKELAPNSPLIDPNTENGVAYKAIRYYGIQFGIDYVAALIQ